MTPERPLIDVEAGVLCLGGGWHACEAVNPDGSRSFWLVAPDARGDDPEISIPDHERTTGPLPAAVRFRLQTYRCGRPTQTGRPCRTPVARPGQTCARHRAERPVEENQP